MTRQMRNLTYRNLMTVIKQIQAKGYDFEESERLARNIFAEFKKPTTGHEHRGMGQEGADERGMGKGKPGMPGVWLLSVVVLPVFFVFWRSLEEVVVYMIVVETRLLNFGRKR